MTERREVSRLKKKQVMLRRLEAREQASWSWFPADAIVECKHCSKTYTKGGNTYCPRRMKTVRVNDSHPGEYREHADGLVTYDDRGNGTINWVYAWSCCESENQSSRGCKGTDHPIQGGKHQPTPQSLARAKEIAKAKYTIPDTIKVATRHCPGGDEEKNTWVKEVVENVERMERMIIFAQERSDVTSLQSKFEAAGLKVSGIHGGISELEQDEALRKFQAKESVVLVSSGIIGRGVDLEGVTHVILYQPPGDELPNYVNFVHKIGRCGRAGAAGTAIVLTSTEQDQKNFALIANEFGLTDKIIRLGNDGGRC